MIDSASGGAEQDRAMLSIQRDDTMYTEHTLIYSLLVDMGIPPTPCFSYNLTHLDYAKTTSTNSHVQTSMAPRV